MRPISLEYCCSTLFFHPSSLRLRQNRKCFRQRTVWDFPWSQVLTHAMAMDNRKLISIHACRLHAICTVTRSLHVKSSQKENMVKCWYSFHKCQIMNHKYISQNETAWIIYMSIYHHSPAMRVDVQSPQVYVVAMGHMVIAPMQPLATSHYCQQMSAETFTTSCFCFCPFP
jgi:hypothetical protein